MKHEDLLNAISHVEAMIAAGHKTSSISGEPSALMQLGLSLEYCAISQETHKMVCIVESEKLLKILMRNKKANEH